MHFGVVWSASNLVNDTCICVNLASHYITHFRMLSILLFSHVRTVAMTELIHWLAHIISCFFVVLLYRVKRSYGFCIGVAGRSWPAKQSWWNHFHCHHGDCCFNCEFLSPVFHLVFWSKFGFQEFNFDSWFQGLLEAYRKFWELVFIQVVF